MTTPPEITDACAETDDFGPDHDDQCESEFVVDVGRWTGCQCEKRWDENITSINQGENT